MVVGVSQVTVVSRESFKFPGENVLLHLQAAPLVGQAAELVDVGVAGHEVGDVVRDLLGSLEDPVAVHTAPALLQVEDLLAEVLGAAPGGGRGTPRPP